MDLRQLEMLVAVMEGGGFSAAGERLHVSHSAVHRQIRLLEHELGVCILVRSGRRVHVTDDGRLLVDLARRIQMEIACVQAKMKEANQLQSGRLRIGTGMAVLTFFLPPVLERFRSQYPKVDVRLSAASGDEVVHDVTTGKLDIGVVYSPADMPPGEAIPSYELLYNDEFALVVGQNHPLGRRKQVTLAEAIQYPLILYRRPSHVRRVLDRILLKAGLTPQIAMELENEEAIERMIAINMGIGFLSRRRAAIDRVRCLNLKGDRFFLDVGLVTPPSGYLSPPAREFAVYCREAARASRP
jgi:DNA-binding transcriptional LysR family regulator